MALRFKAYAPNTILKAVDVQDLADNGLVQIDTAADLDDADLVNVNMVYVVAEAKPYVRQAAGVGADKWQVFSGGLSGLGGWAEITATTGSPTKHEYTDADGNDWTAYEFTGDGTITNTAGLMDCMIISGGAFGTASYSGAGGRTITGTQLVPAHVGETVVVGAGGTNSMYYGTASGFGAIGVTKTATSPQALGGAGGYQKVPGAVESGNQANDDSNCADISSPLTSSITGAPQTYGMASRSAPRPNRGDGGTRNNSGSSGVVIVRVPRANAKA